MLHLLKIEWLKVKNYRAFWIFLGLYVAALIGINYVAYYIQGQIKTQLPIELFPYNFPLVYQTIAWISSWLLYFPGMIMILVISNEYSFKTHRQNIIDGLERKQFIISKILFAIILAIILTICCFIIALVFGAIFSSSISFEGIEYMGYCFIQSLCYLFFAMILAVLLRRSGLAMAIFFLYGLVFENLIGGLVDRFVIHGHYFYYYMPLEASDVMVPMTFGNKIFYPDAPATITLLIVCLVYIGLYCFFSIRKFETDDL
ncbi:MAG TPA: ABC transporter permease [Chitinophagaceae bacterium]|nr:ABC transporter permease [Chitinophagaceae bacterium]